MAHSDEKIRSDLGEHERGFYWDWSGENPVEIVLVIFILVLFFTLPRTGCGIDKKKGEYPTRPRPAASAKPGAGD